MLVIRTRPLAPTLSYLKWWISFSWFSSQLDDVYGERAHWQVSHDSVYSPLCSYRLLYVTEYLFQVIHYVNTNMNLAVWFLPHCLSSFSCRLEQVATDSCVAHVCERIEFAQQLQEWLNTPQRSGVGVDVNRHAVGRWKCYQWSQWLKYCLDINI